VEASTLGSRRKEVAMSPTVREWMQQEVRSVPPTITLVDLDERFVRDKVSGFPVTVDGKLEGIVSRSDIVHQLQIERTWAEQVSDFYRDFGGREADGPTLQEIGAAVGRRIEKLTVRDVMSEAVVTIGPDDSLAVAARILVDRTIHRMPVVEDGGLVGILTTLDLSRYVSENVG
jgi:CBS domain-containing protein